MFDRHHHAALNTAIADRTRLADALQQLLTSVQIALPNMAPAHLLRAEAAAVAALEAVGGPPCSERTCLSPTPYDNPASAWRSSDTDSK